MCSLTFVQFSVSYQWGNVNHITELLAVNMLTDKSLTLAEKSLGIRKENFSKQFSD